jgi:type II secretory pathway component GspD/PulD (secretin)
MKKERQTKVLMGLLSRRMIAILVIMGMILMPHPLGTDCARAQAEVEVMNSMHGATSGLGQSTNNEADKLLSKYFRRIDSYLKENKYMLAKNELKKIYLIDPNNPKAKNYATLIDKSEQERLKIKEESHVQKDALLMAEKKMRRKREISTAHERLEEKRIDEAWTSEGEYVRSGEFNVSEFERLQSLGVEKYKSEIVAEARKFLVDENFDKAISRYKDALAIDPGDFLIRELLNKAKKEREKRLDDLLKEEEEIEDRQFMQEVTKSAMGIDDYRRSMQGHGYAKPMVGYKPKQKASIYDQLQIPVTADFRDVDLVSVINFLSDYTGINIITSQLVSTESRPITVRFKELPLERALKYIIKGQGLRYRIEDDLIYIATIEEMDGEELETRVYYLERGSGVFTTFSSTNMGTLGQSGGSASVSGRRTIKDLIEEAVPFPPGAKVVFDDKTGALIVTNTPTNLQKIEEVIYTIDESPQQISIESRFIEVSVDEINNFGISSNIDSRMVHSAENDIGTTISNIFTGISSSPNSDTGGLAINLTGLLSDPQFSMVLNALNRLDKTKTLSAPKITTVNNQTATIKIVTEEVFPTRFEVSLIQQDLNGDGDFDDAGETEFANVPQEFVSRDIGIILQVTPSVGIDKRTITLSIVPEVSSVAQSPAKFPITSFDANGNEVQMSSGTPNLPRFTTSTLSTTVVLDSGQTAVLGGLIKESRGTTKEKFPFLGDLPYIGTFFRSTQDQVDRTNLVIFITARVVSN